MLASILYAFAFTNGSLRNIEEKCMYDIRYKYISNNIKSSYATISNFINDVIKPNIDEIFSLITKAIFDECSLSMDDIFIDGTKLEADANKYKFVWKPTKFHERLSEKIRVLLKKYNIQNSIPANGVISSKIISQKVNELDNLVLNDINNKELNKDYKLLIEYLSKSLEYKEKERICGDNRNSYYKTDHDATAMCLKRDYYSSLGSN